MTSAALPPAPGESAINTPHPEDQDPADFFGDDGAENGAEHSLMPEEGAAEEEQESAAEEGAAQEEQPPEPQGEGAGEEPPPAPAEHPKAPEPSIGQALEGQQFDEGDGPKEVTSTGGVEAESPAAQEQAAGGKGAATDEAASTKKNGPRGYVVVREILFTQDYVDHFAKQLEEGKDPHTIYMVLEPKVEARNPTPVLMSAFKKHHKRLGQPLRLLAIPLSVWKVRTLELKPKVIDDNISID